MSEPVPATTALALGGGALGLEALNQRGSSTQLEPLVQSLHLAKLLEALPLIMFRLDLDGTILSDQGGGLAAWGLKAHENVGRSAFEVFAGSGPVGEILKRALAGERFTARTTVGDLAYDTRYEPIMSGDQLIGTVGVAFDVTEQALTERALRASEARYRQLVTTASEGIVVLDNDFNITFVNPGLCAMLGYTESEFLGSNAFDYVDPAYQHTITENEVTRTLKDSYQFDMHYLHKTGASVPTLISSQPICNDEGSVTGLFAMVADITGLRTEEAVRVQLQHDVAQAESKEQQRLSRALHDGPIQQLAAVNLKLGALRRTNLDRAMAKDLTTIEHEIGDAVRSLRLLMFDIEQCDPADVTGAIRSCASLLFAQTGVEVVVRGDVPEQGLIVANTMYRIAREALVNSRKHSQASRVTVQLGVQLNGIWMSVRDNGIGIADRLKPSRESFGVRSMLARANEMGGLANVEPAQPACTAVYAWLPSDPRPNVHVDETSLA